MKPTGDDRCNLCVLALRCVDQISVNTSVLRQLARSPTGARPRAILRAPARPPTPHPIQNSSLLPHPKSCRPSPTPHAATPRPVCVVPAAVPSSTLSSPSCQFLPAIVCAVLVVDLRPRPPSAPSSSCRRFVPSGAALADSATDLSLRPRPPSAAGELVLAIPGLRSRCPGHRPCMPSCAQGIEARSRGGIRPHHRRGRRRRR